MEIWMTVTQQTKQTLFSFSHLIVKKVLLQVSIVPQTQNSCIKTQNHRGIDFLENKYPKY